MIDDLSSGVKRLNEMAHTIQDEIQQHDQLIDGIEIEVDVAQTRLERGRKEIERFLKTRSDRNERVTDCFRLVPHQNDLLSLFIHCVLRVLYISILTRSPIHSSIYDSLPLFPRANNPKDYDYLEPSSSFTSAPSSCSLSIVTSTSSSSSGMID